MPPTRVLDAPGTPGIRFENREQHGYQAGSMVRAMAEYVSTLAKKPKQRDLLPLTQHFFSIT